LFFSCCPRTPTLFLGVLFFIMEFSKRRGIALASLHLTLPPFPHFLLDFRPTRCLFFDSKPFPTTRSSLFTKDFPPSLHLWMAMAGFSPSYPLSLENLPSALHHSKSLSLPPATPFEHLFVIRSPLRPLPPQFSYGRMPTNRDPFFLPFFLCPFLVELIHLVDSRRQFFSPVVETPLTSLPQASPSNNSST